MYCSKPRQCPFQGRLLWHVSDCHLDLLFSTVNEKLYNEPKSGNALTIVVFFYFLSKVHVPPTWSLLFGQTGCLQNSLEVIFNGAQTKLFLKLDCLLHNNILHTTECICIYHLALIVFHFNGSLLCRGPDDGHMFLMMLPWCAHTCLGPLDVALVGMLRHTHG